MKILKEEAQYHHGSFKDLQTFLDKNGDPYTLIKSEYPQDKSTNTNKNNSDNQNNNQDQKDNQNKSDSNNQSSNQANNQSNNQQNQNNNQNQQNNNQTQQNQNSQQQNQKKVPPDPNASYVDVNTGFEYKWDPQKNKFMKVGKYRAR